jgi:hypothetical protein
MQNKELDLFKVLIPAIDNNIKELYDAAGDDGKKDIKGDHPRRSSDLIGFKKKDGANSKAIKLLEQLYPELKLDEVELLARISTKKELKQLAEDHEIAIKF